MKKTLLELTQDILSAMDSDEVNSIGDTVESQQVVRVIETVYNNILARTEFEEQKELFELKASGDPDKPNLFYKPNSVDTIEWLKYNSSDNNGYDELIYKHPAVFVEDMYNYRSNYKNDLRLNTYELMNGDSSITIAYLNDTDPTYYTYISGIGIVLDGVNLLVEDTAQKTRTLAYGRKNYNFVEDDEFVPSLDGIHFNILYQESKELAFAELKQTTHAIAQKNAKDSRIHAQRRKDQTNGTDFYRRLPNYGRGR